MSQNNAHIHSIDALGGVEVLIANFINYQFETHWHDTWSVGAVISGAHDNSPKATGDGIVNSGQVTMIAPGELHGGRVLGTAGCKYVMFYFQHSELMTAFDQLGGNAKSFSNMIYDAPELHRALINLAQLIVEAQSPSSFDIDASWIRCLSLIAEQISQTDVPTLQASQHQDNKKLLLAREYLDAHANEFITLDQLAHEVSLSKYHLCRQFSRIFKMPPNKYLRQLRLQRAKELLNQGYPITEVALNCGFSDQSHMGRHFKAVFGVSPKKYAVRSK